MEAAKRLIAMTHKIIALQRIRGIGENFAAVLAREVFYRSFTNRRQLASYVGITPMPYQSGGMDRDRASAEPATQCAHHHDPARLALAALSARTARSPRGSATASVRCRGALGGSLSWRWPESC